MAEFFNVVFAGQIAPGSDPETVKANIGRLFKANDAALARLFSGQRIAVKKAVDQATAMKYRAVMKQAGAIALIEAADAQGAPLPAADAAPPAAVPPVAAAAPAPRPAVPPTTPPPARAPTMAERLAAIAAEEAKKPSKPAGPATPPPADEANAGTWKLFPAGSRLVESAPLPEVVLPDISSMSMAKPGGDLLDAKEREQLAPPPVAVPDVTAIGLAPAGSDLLKTEERRAEIPVAVDISALTMAPANTDVLKPEEKQVVVPVSVDVSGMSMAPPGGDLGQMRDEKKPVVVDISHLRVAG